MGEIAIIHMDLMAKGGGEAVAMNVIEALQDDYEVTVLTLTDPDIPELNAYFNTNVAGVRVRQAGNVAPWLHETFGLKYYVLQNALLGRYARDHADEFDLLVSTINELGLEADAVQYIHFPFDWTVSLDNREQIFHPTVEEASWYERLCTSVAGVTRSDIQSNVLLANSEWTADIVEDAYGTEPKVVYPPIDTTEFDPRPWDDREEGFVTIGRIERSKRIAELIRIVDGVRERGHDVHLHVIGPTVDEEYREEIDAMTATRPYIEIEGEIPREDLVERICTHRYGIHGKEYEHFGMAVAELAAGGTIPFVPASGGQHAIVGDDRLTYESITDAVERIDHVTSTAECRSDLRMRSEEIRERFGCERFKEAIRSIVNRSIQSSTEQGVEKPVALG